MRHYRHLAALLFVFVLLSCLFGGVVFLEGRNFCTVDPGLEYSFVVRICAQEASAAVVQEVYTSGGAGYPLSEGVIVACYFEKTDAERTAAMLGERGEEAFVQTCTARPFTLEGKKASSHERVLSLLLCADSCARLLFDTANGLERGETGQEEARAAVRGAAAALRAPTEFSLWSGEMNAIAREAESAASGILFARDLRLLQTRLCLATLRAGKMFG